MLHDEDYRHLVTDSAISDDVLARCGVHTAETDAELPAEFRRYIREYVIDSVRPDHVGATLTYPDPDPSGLTPAIVFDRRDPHGTSVPQIKPRLGEDRSEPYYDRDGQAHKYLVPTGSSSLLWQVADPGQASTLVIAEGTKQALSLASWCGPDVAVYSIAGCQNWKSAGLPLPALSTVAGKRVVICLDGDAATNRQVFDAGVELRGACEAEGAASVRFARLPTADSSGIDDVLAARDESERAEYVTGLLARTHAKPAQRRPAASRSSDPIDSDREQVEATDRQIADAYVARYRETVGLIDGSQWAAYDHARGVWSLERGTVLARARVNDLRDHVQAVTHTTTNEGLPVVRDETVWMETSTRLTSVLTEVAARAEVHHRRADFDAIPTTSYLFAVANGTIDLRTGDLLDHDPAHMITRRSEVVYDPHASAERFHTFLAQVMPDPEMRAFLARLFGMSLIGEVTEHRLPVFVGSGRNGKGTLLRLVSAVLGEYHSGIAKSLLTKTKFEDHATVLASLWRKRLVTTEEFADSAQWDIPRIKELTGGDALTARFSHGDEFTFTPSHTLILATNSWPSADVAEEAFWARVLRVPFEVSIPHPDHTVEADIAREELPGVLAWMVAGCRDYLANGLGEPPAVLMATRQARMESSVVGRFLDEQIEVTGSGDDMLSKNEVYESYTAWLRRSGPGGPAKSMRKFVEEVRALNLAGVEEYTERVQRARARTRTDRKTSYWTGLRWTGGNEQPFDKSAPDPAGGADPGEARDPSSKMRVPGRDPSSLPSSQDRTGRDPEGLVCNSGNQREKNTENEDEKKRNSREASTIGSSGSLGVPSGPRGPSPSSEPGAEPGPHASTPLVFDLETASADALHTAELGTFVRLAGYTDPREPDRTRVSERPSELVDTIAAGTGPVIGHNILAFDLPALAVHHGLDLAALGQTDRIRDTRLLAQLHDPPWSGKFGRNRRGYYSLDSVAERMGLPGKSDDLAELAKAHGGFDQIPTDDERFREYLRGDVAATAALAEHLPSSDYTRREHRAVARLTAASTVTGFRVDTELVDQRLAEGRAQRQEILARLHAEHGLPLTDAKGREIRSPAATEAGKEAIRAAFAERGVELGRTAKSGAVDLSKTALTDLAERRPEVADLAGDVLALNGIRTVYGTVSEHLAGDRVHPAIWPGQSSGRWSVTSPGMTVFGKRDGKFREREIFLPEPGEVLLAADLDQVDMRAVAALSGDVAYQRLFEPGRDAHTEMAVSIFGDPARREDAKMISHAFNYGRSTNSLIERDGIDPEKAITFAREMREQFPAITAWQAAVREQAEQTETLDNGWGRIMRCDADSAYTQAPALVGQGCARDMLVEGILRLPPEIAAMIRTVVHDEVVFSVPAEHATEIAEVIRTSLTIEFRGVPVTAGVAGPAGNWGALYAK